MAELTGANTLLDVTVWSQEGIATVLDLDNGDVGGAGATISVPNYLLCHDPWVSFMCRLDENDSFTVRIRIGLNTRKSFDYSFDFYGNPLLEFASADTTATLGADLSGDSFEFVEVDPLSIFSSLDKSLYLPAIAR